jgi:hypothetical protein
MYAVFSPRLNKNLPVSLRSCLDMRFVILMLPKLAGQVRLFAIYNGCV